MPEQSRTIADLVYVGFNSQVVALDRYTGESVWTWKSPKGSGYVAVVVDGDRIIACVNGYMYCLDPLFGQEVWSNPLKGLGVGTPCVATFNAPHGSMSSSALGAVAAAAAQAANKGAGPS